MYILTKEDKDILVNYRAFLQSEVAASQNEQVKMILSKSVELLSGEITTETLENYLAVQVKNGPNKLMELSEEAKSKVNEIRVAAANYGVMDVVKRYKQG